MNETRSFKKGLQVISSLEIKSLNTGYVKCLAVNSIGEDSAVNAYYVTGWSTHNYKRKIYC